MSTRAAEYRLLDSVALCLQQPRLVPEALSVLALYLDVKNPRWHEQPRMPAGVPDGGQWVSGGSRQVYITAVISALAKAIAPIRKYVITTMQIVPLPILTDAPPRLASDDHVIYTPSARRPYMPYLEFESFVAFKYVLGALAPGYHLHHIVEQRMANQLGKFPARAVHNTDNIILLSRAEHSCISRYYSSAVSILGQRYSQLRYALNDKSWAEQYLIGISYIHRCRRETKPRKSKRR